MVNYISFQTNDSDNQRRYSKKLLMKLIAKPQKIFLLFPSSFPPNDRVNITLVSPSTLIGKEDKRRKEKKNIFFYF